MSLPEGHFSFGIVQQPAAGALLGATGFSLGTTLKEGRSDSVFEVWPRKAEKAQPFVPVSPLPAAKPRSKEGEREPAGGELGKATVLA
jgi:hypothetical protein